MQRPPLLPRFFKPIAGGPNMFDMREHEWRPWRAKFNRAFSADHVLSLVPDMIDETLVYSETLQKYSEEDKMFSLDLTTLRFTIDVIGKTILYVSTVIVLLSVKYADDSLETRTWGLREDTMPWQTACSVKSDGIKQMQRRIRLST